jgi:pSer/pThr/pTyr-binding forkhead associated (FHA) protein
VFTPNTWTIVIGSDRDYYDRMQLSRNLGGPPVAFPEHGSERMVALAGKQMRIGRRSAARSLRPEIDLADPPTDPGVSRLHAVFIATADGTWAVLDPGSANGTLLNGREIPVGDLVPLRDGDRINLGAWTVITVRRG